MNAETPSIDFAAVARLALGQAESLVAQWFPAGRKRGHEWVVGNLAGDAGESLSININTGAWGDFASDVRGGDLVALYAAIHRIGQGEAARRLAAELGQPLDECASRPTPAAPRQAETVAEWVPVIPIPVAAPPPPSAHPAHGKPTHIASYRNREGQIIGLIYRCEPAGKRKQIVPLTWCRHQDGREAWQWKSLPKPRSLYGAELLDGAPNRTVLAVEGEGKCDAARRLLGSRMTVVAWPGGASAASLADWALLRHRTVIVWPDADEPGLGRGGKHRRHPPAPGRDREGGAAPVRRSGQVGLGRRGARGLDRGSGDGPLRLERGRRGQSVRPPLRQLWPPSRCLQARST